MPKNICETPKCGNDIPAGRGSQGGPRVCDRCYSGLSYARAQGKGWLGDRKERLDFLLGRAEFYEGLVGRLLKRTAQRVSDARARVNH